MRFVPPGVACHDTIVVGALRIHQRHRSRFAHCPTFVLVVGDRAVRRSEWVTLDRSRLVIIHGKRNHQDVVYCQFGTIDARTHPARGPRGTICAVERVSSQCCGVTRRVFGASDAWHIRHRENRHNTTQERYEPVPKSIHNDALFHTNVYAYERNSHMAHVIYYVL